MAVWQASFHIVPHERVAELFPGWFEPPLDPDYVATLPTEDPSELDWWSSRHPPADFRANLDRLAPRLSSWSSQLQLWGSEDGDRVDVFLEGGRVESI